MHPAAAICGSAIKAGGDFDRAAGIAHPVLAFFGRAQGCSGGLGCQGLRGAGQGWLGRMARQHQLQQLVVVGYFEGGRALRTLRFAAAKGLGVEQHKGLAQDLCAQGAFGHGFGHDALQAFAQCWGVAVAGLEAAQVHRGNARGRNWLGGRSRGGVDACYTDCQAERAAPVAQQGRAGWAATGLWHRASPGKGGAQTVETATMAAIWQVLAGLN